MTTNIAARMDAARIACIANETGVHTCLDDPEVAAAYAEWTKQDGREPEPFELEAETVAQEPRHEPEPTLMLGYTDRSFTRPTSKRDRLLAAHAAATAPEPEPGLF